MKTPLLPALTLAAFISGVAEAQTLTDIGTANPTPGPNDISQLSTNGNTAATTPSAGGKPDGLNYYSNNGSPPGQTFTTTTTSTNLIALAIRTAGLDSGGGYGTPSTITNYYLRIYSVSGSTATLITSVTAKNPGFTDGDWLKFSGLSIPLAANSTYAYSFSCLPQGGANSWVAMAVSTNTYSGGQIALIPTNGGTMTFGSGKRYEAVFDAGMTANAPTANTPVASPSSSIYVGTTVSMTESALGQGTLSYQWQTDGGAGGSLTNIPNATGTNIAVTLANVGTYNYDVVVSDSFGTNTSSVLPLVTLPPETVTVNTASPIAPMPPQGLGVCTAVYDGYLITSQVAPLLAAAGITAQRYPGGSYADIFNWQTTTVNGGAYIDASDSFQNFMTTDVVPSGGGAIVTVNYGSNPANNAGGDPTVAAAWVNNANNTKRWGVKYWEIGNEVGGNGYYAGSDWEYDLHYTNQTASARVGQPTLSPAAYGSNSVVFINDMKAQDPTIKCGVGFNPSLASYNSGVLGVCGSLVDFVIIHWYPGDDAPSLLASTLTIAPTAQTTFTQLTNVVGATHASQMSIAVTETGAGNVTGAPVSLFAADNYLTWFENGAVNVDYQILHNDIIDVNYNTGAQFPGHAYYGAQMAHFLASGDDTLLNTTSSQTLLRVHAAARQDGRIGVMLINENPTTAIPATVTISGTSLSSTGVIYQFGLTNFIGTNDFPSYAVSTQSVTGLGNQFTVTVPAYTMIDVLVSPASSSAPVLAAIGNQTVNVGQAVAFTATATDTNLPTPTLTFSLLNGPTNASLVPIDNDDASFSWRPLVTQANTTNLIELEVSDNGAPPLSATQSFTVIVNPLTSPSFSSVLYSNGQLTFQINGEQGPDYGVEVSTNLTNWSMLFLTNSSQMPFVWTDTNAANLPTQFYRVQAGPPLP